MVGTSDEAEFGLRLHLKFVRDEDETDLDEDEAAEDVAETGALGLMFTLGVLSFADAKLRETFVLDYVEGNEFKLADILERLRFVRGELHFDADYIRGHRVKTRITVRSSGTVTLETIGRGNCRKAGFRTERSRPLSRQRPLLIRGDPVLP